jgi:hypothetical protein
MSSDDVYIIRYVWGIYRLGVSPPGLPEILPETSFLRVPIYLTHVPLIFGDSKPHFLHQHSKRRKKKKEKKKREKSHD